MEVDQPLRLVEQALARDDPDPKALACYGLLLPATNEVWLRFLDGRPVSAVTISFLDWCCQEAARRGKAALLLIWDNAAWHVSKRVRAWIKAHNRQAKRDGGVRMVACYLPVKSPWLNAIEPKWVHGKKAIAEPERKLTAQEVKDRAYLYYGCEHVEPLKQNVA